MALLPATFRFSPASGGTPRPATGRRAAAGAPGFSPGKGRQGTQQGRLRLCRYTPEDWRPKPMRCPGDLILAPRWWTPELRPEDLIEPTGQGVEELKAIRDALLRDPLQPVWITLKEIVATGGNLFRCQCFHVGVLSGPLLIVAGLCKLYTVAPNLFMDIVLGYMFYKMSVLAANLKREGRSNDICGRIQFVLMLILFLKCNNPTKDYRFTEFFWTIAIQVYASKVYCEIVDLKYPRQEFEGLFKAILTAILTPFKEMLKP